jgi:hypothetical protein
MIIIKETRICTKTQRRVGTWWTPLLHFMVFIKWGEICQIPSIHFMVFRGGRHMPNNITTFHATWRGLGSCRTPSIFSCFLEGIRHMPSPLTTSLVFMKRLCIRRIFSLYFMVLSRGWAYAAHLDYIL